jgi:hypothetical protein
MRKIRGNRSVPSLLAAAGMALMTTGAALAQPANDLCSAAQVVTLNSSTSGTNVGATSDVPNSSCAFTPTDARDVWFVYTPAATGLVLIDTEGSTGLTDTTLSVWSGCGGVELYCDDDGGSGLLSRLLVNLLGGVSYYIRVAGWNNTTGAFLLNVSAPPAPPANDTCAGATVVTAGSSTAGNNSGATSDVFQSSCSFQDQFDVWYSFTPASTAFYDINTEGSTGLTDTTLQIYSACGGAELYCDDDAGTGLLSRINVILNAGTNYRIRVAGYASSVGAFVLNVGNPVAPPTAPPNDNCVTATNITSLPFASAIDIAGATDDADLASCNSPSATTTPNGVWYTYTPAVNQRIRVLENSVLNTFLSIFTSSSDCNGVFTEVPGACGFDEILDVTAGTTYYILVGAFPATPLPPPAVIDFSVVEVIPPANDDCSSAQALTGALPISVSGTNLGAASEIPNSSCPPLPSDSLDVWYSYVAQATTNGTTVIDTEGSALFDTTLSIWSACGGVELFCDDDSGTGLRSRLNVALTTGTTYYIRVAGYNNTFGNFNLNISEGPAIISPSSNDTCGTAMVVTGTLNVEEDTTTALNENAEPLSNCNLNTAVGLDNSVWFTFTPGASGQLTGSISGNYDMIASLFTGSCGSLVEVACWDEPEPFDLAAPEFGSSSLTAGVQYWLAIGDWGVADGGGATQINITVPGAPVNGACCSGATCFSSTAAACTGANTAYRGDGTVCNVFGVNNTTPCCLADFNQSGSVTVQDIFDYLSAYFTANGQADINGGGITVQDIFDYLAIYFAGCP